MTAAARKTTDTRTRILELAEAAVLEKGFASTSIDELITGAGITKSGFFYHFRDKGELAKALMQRYIAEHDLPYNALHDRGYPTIGCTHCTVPGAGREGRWTGTGKTECGLHA